MNLRRVTPTPYDRPARTVATPQLNEGLGHATGYYTSRFEDEAGHADSDDGAESAGTSNATTHMIDVSQEEGQ